MGGGGVVVQGAEAGGAEGGVAVSYSQHNEGKGVLLSLGVSHVSTSHPNLVTLAYPNLSTHLKTDLHMSAEQSRKSDQRPLECGKLTSMLKNANYR